MAVVNDVRLALEWGALSAHDQWCEDTRWSDGSKRPTDRHIALKVRSGHEIGGEDLKRFATEYGVGRFPQYKVDASGEPASDRNGGRISDAAEIAQRISSAIDCAYRPAIGMYGGDNTPPPDGKAVAELWWKAIEAVRPHTRQTSKSLCKKVMWYYLPAKVTMWDTFAARSLLTLAEDLNVSQADRRALLGSASGRTSAGEFLGAFITTFERLHDRLQVDAHRISVEVAQALNAEPYPYTRRIVDKALWFLGAEDDKRRAVEIAHAIKRYPTCKAPLSAASARYAS